MAIKMTTTLSNGLVAKDAYWRLNSFSQLPNRQADGSYSVPVVALFRAFVSEAAFKSGKPYIDEMQISFIPSSISGDLADEAYTAFKSYDPTLLVKKTIEDAENNLIEVNKLIEYSTETLATKDAEIANLKSEDAKLDNPGGPLFASKLLKLTNERSTIAEKLDKIEDQSVELMTKIIPTHQAELAMAEALFDEFKTAVDV